MDWGISVKEIDETIAKMNWKPKDVHQYFLTLAHIQGYFTGKDVERHNIKVSSPGESDWVKLMMHFKKQNELIVNRFNAWLLTQGVEFSEK